MCGPLAIHELSWLIVARTSDLHPVRRVLMRHKANSFGHFQARAALAQGADSRRAPLLLTLLLISP